MEMVAIPQKSEVVSNRIELLKRLPFGQRMIRVGFNNISYKDLMNRLGCTAVNDRNEKQAKRKAQYIAFLANKKQEEQRLKSFFKKKKKPYLAIKWMDDDGDEYYSPCKKIILDEWLEEWPSGTPGKTIKKRSVCFFPWNQYKVDFINLEDYAEGKIPVRCLKNVILAKTLGAKHFWVAKPTLKIPDPIIVATRENKIDTTDEPDSNIYYEIDMWE